MCTSVCNSGVLISHLKKIKSKQNPKALTCSAVVFAFFFFGNFTIAISIYQWFNYQLARFLSIYQLALASWYKPASVPKFLLVIYILSWIFSVLARIYKQSDSRKRQLSSLGGQEHYGIYCQSSWVGYYRKTVLFKAKWYQISDPQASSQFR